VSAWERKDGSPAATLELRAQTVKFLGRPAESETDEGAREDNDAEPF